MRVVLSLGAVALVSLGVYALEHVAPVLSLGVLYLFAVLPVAALWGLRYAVPVSIVSMLAFNWFFLPPTHTFQLQDSENWVALAVFLVTAVSVSALATRQRAVATCDSAGRHAGRYRMATHWDSRIAKARRVAHGEVGLEPIWLTHGRCSAKRRPFPFPD